jgi:hypothetical protein
MRGQPRLMCATVISSTGSNRTLRFASTLLLWCQDSPFTNCDGAAYARQVAARLVETIWMKRRTQFSGWLSAAGLCGTLGYSSLAYAAHPEKPPSSPTSPKAAADRVNPSSEKKSTLPAAPVQLQLKPPVVLAPLHMPKHKYEEVRIWGLTIPTFVAYGLSGVSAGGAVLTGYAARRGNDPSSCDTCREHGVRQRALFITTGVLTGMAVAGLSVGITFMVKAQTKATHDAIRPRLDLGFSGEKAVAKIGWVFSSF